MDCRNLILIALAAGGADTAHSEPLLPEKIVYQEASCQQVIPYREGVLVESDHYEADKVMYAQFDAKETSTFKIEGIQHMLDVEPSSTGILFLGLNEIDEKVSLALIEETARDSRRSISLPEELQRIAEDLQPSTILPRLFGTSNAVAAIAGDKVYWLDKEWHSRNLPKVPQFYKEFKPATFGAVRFLDGTTLYAGWDHGEWGGMLASIDLSTEGSGWIHLSGKPAGDASGIPENNPVHTIMSPSKGHIWVATGLAHMGGTWRGLHHRDPEGMWHTLIDGEFTEDRGQLKFPVPSSIEELASDHEGRTYILAGEAGVFRLGASGLERLFEHNFFSHSSDRGDYIVGSYPSALGIARNGDIFVSTNNFGVLAFRKKDDDWTARQITLKKRDNKARHRIGHKLFNLMIHSPSIRARSGAF